MIDRNQEALDKIAAIIDGYTWEYEPDHDTDDGLGMAEDALEKIAEVMGSLKQGGKFWLHFASLCAQTGRRHYRRKRR